MAANVLPLFWNLASSSKDTRLNASADLVSSLEGFQVAFLANQTNGSSSNHGSGLQVNGDGESDDEEDDEEADDASDAESGVEVDGSDDDEEMEDDAARLDQELSSRNAEDVSYSVKRLVRGLASSRESNRLGFAVALTELLSRVPSITASQVVSLLVRSAPVSQSMKGAEQRDMMFARLFGFNAVINSGTLFSSTSSLEAFESVVEGLILLGKTKAWMRESAWWALIGALRGVSSSKVEWKQEAMELVLEQIQGEKEWTQEKLALVLLLESSSPNLDFTDILRPTFKHTPLLSSGNLPTLARVLKEADTEEDESTAATSSTGSWKPQLHFVWNLIFDSYFSATPSSNQAPFPAFFHTVVDESLFANTSSSQRRYWGFQVFQRALPLADETIAPQLFTPNFMRCWMNNLSSSDRYLHKAALGTAKVVQDVVKTSPKIGFALLSRILGKHGRPDFDKVTKTKTVEGIMGNLTVDGVREYVGYLQGIVLGTEDSSSDAKALDDRREWAIEQLHALCRNTSVPKDDEWIRSVLQFLLVHGFFVIRKSSKKGHIAVLQHIPKPALSESSAEICRSRLYSCLVELTTFSPTRPEGDATKVVPAHAQGCDAKGKLWLRHVVDWYRELAADKHVEAMIDADDEIQQSRDAAYETLKTLSKSSDTIDTFRGVEILLSFVLLQTYEDNEDALDLLDDLNAAAEKICKKSGSTSSSEEAPPIDVLLDTLIAQLDKGSNDLRNLASLVFGMVSSAFTKSSIEHLIAQLEQTAAEAAANAADEEVDEDEDEEEDDEEDEEKDEDEEDDEEVEEDSDSAEDLDDEEMGDVDPAFRQRVADALKAAGMGVDEDASESESDADSEVWDDDQMMKVDEQLAEIFRQQHGSGSKKADLKNQQIENMHFKTRVLDLFDTFARKQITNPLVLDLILPLLRLIHSAGQSERDLASKASGILRSRLGKAKEVPTLTDKDKPTELLEAIHEMVRKAASADLSALCSVCSIFVARSIDASHPTSSIVRDTYQETIENFLTKKASLVHPNLILDYLRRFPERAWPLTGEICKLLAPSQSIVNTFRKVQGYSMLQVFTQHLPQLAKSPIVDAKQIVSFVTDSSALVFDTLEAAIAGEADWKADRLKEVVKFALSLARVSKSAEAASRGWDATRLASVREKFDANDKTKGMKGVSQMLAQLSALLSATVQGKKKQGKVAKQVKTDGHGDVSMTNGVAESVVDEQKKSAKVKKVRVEEGGEGKLRKRKSDSGLAAGGKEARAKKVKTA